MFARVSTIQGSPEKAEDAIRHLRETVIPAAREVDGFKGAYFLLNRETGKSVGMTLWSSEEAMKSSETQVQQLRSDSAQEAGGEIQSVELYEVVAEA